MQKKPVNVAINGFGRMGRLAMRHCWDSPDLRIVAINESACDAETGAYLLQFDSVHGVWASHDVSTTRMLPAAAAAAAASSSSGDPASTELNDGKHNQQGFEAILVDGTHAIQWTRADHPGACPWASKRGVHVDMVLECTGAFVKDKDSLLAHGVPKVVVSAPVKVEGVPAIVFGVNQHIYFDACPRPALVSAASCTTNCLAPILHVLMNHVHVVRATFTTIHDVTATQMLVDRPGAPKDVRRCRSSLLSLIPTSTGSAKAICKIFPQLKGHVSGTAVRVPLQGASLVDLVVEVSGLKPQPIDDTSAPGGDQGVVKAKNGERSEEEEEEEEEEKTIKLTANLVNSWFSDASKEQGSLHGFLGLEHRPLVGIDYSGEKRSAVVDANLTTVVDHTTIKIFAWYDNETGYVARMLDLAAAIAKAEFKA